MDNVLAELSPEQFKEWIAALDVVPTLEGWEQAGTVAAAIHDAISRVIASFGGEFKAANVGDFQPRLKFTDEEEEKQDTIKGFQELMAKRFR